MTRNCLPCTECCRGHVEAHVGDHHLTYQSPCPDVTESGCGRGDSRPDEPCKAFLCGWILNDDLVEEMRPDLSGVIMVENTYLNTDTIVATRGEIDLSVKEVFARRALATGRQLIIKEIRDEAMWVTPIGSPQFMNKINEMASAGERIE